MIPSLDTGATGRGAVASQSARIVEDFFREQSRRLQGTLTRILGPSHLSVVDDIVQESLLRALRTWSIGGIPDNPTGWITRVAINLARDTVRRWQTTTVKAAELARFVEQQLNPQGDVASDEADVADNTLRLLFVCCHPTITPEAQVMLALKVLCGFTPRQMAAAYLSSEAAIEKQLARTKRRIRDAHVAFDLPEGGDLTSRLNSVHTALYLLFNEGYKASSGDQLIRHELCREAIRLTNLLLTHPVGRTPRTHALLALMLLTAARFPSRLDGNGDLSRLTAQDRARWDQALLDRGLQHLAQSAQGDDLSAYHVEAGIAAAHGVAPEYGSTDWNFILKLYDRLVGLKPSPIVTLNRAVALSHVHGPRAALTVLESTPHRERLKSHYLFHVVAGEMHRQLDAHEQAADCFREALRLAELSPEQAHITRRLEQSAVASRAQPPRA